MDSWIFQPGFPLVLATLDGDDLVLTQQRFAYGDTDDATTWVIPVHVRCGEASQRVLLDSPSTRVALPDATAPVVVNAGGERLLPRRLLRRAAQPPHRRDAGDPRHVGALRARRRRVERGRRRRLAGAAFVTFVEGFAADRDLAVWQAILLGLRGLGRTLDDTDYPRFQERVVALLRPVVTDLGEPTEDEDDLRGKLRGIVTAALAVLGHDDTTIAACRELYDASRRG